ncbi:hypothetical protein [Okeania sp. SIO1I7]|uniref:hypothetical protein n=1 Tax=Okeania sp. SIO1I7 TaxID=2607772 RepID=UPI0013FAB227|nr:hypothetical protein [Okeania sp. SIO1I7]NET25099.1 hypothetical protein [Okeania sp. SIO1I7]
MKSEVRSQKSEAVRPRDDASRKGTRTKRVRSYFCNGDLSTPPKIFCLKRRVFRPNYFDKNVLRMNLLKILQKFPFGFLFIRSLCLNSLFDKFKIILILLLVTNLISCGKITETAIKLNLNVSRISKIQTKGKIDRQVYLKGTVESQAPFLETGAYELTDDTGSIWIFTTAELPEVGTEITIKGKISYQSIVVPELGNQDVGDFYVEEIERVEVQNQNQE